MTEARKTRPGRALYLAAWLPFLTVYLAAFVAVGIPIGLAVRNAVANVLPDALFATVVLRLSRRLPWPERERGRFFSLHAAALFAFVAASTAGWLALVGIDSLIFGGAFRIQPRIIPFRVVNDLLIYGTVAALGYAGRSAAAAREQAARADRAEALRARAELETMRSQLQPHFILNTLHALLGLVHRDPAAAEEALETLGDLLRYSLRVQREGVDEVALRDEAAFVSSYLDVEKLRMGDRLKTRFDVPEDALESRVPTFSLQTLVENAVRHAVAPRPDGGSISIRAERGQGRLRIVVEDDGPGIAAGALHNGGLGLRLLRERVAVLHAGAARLDVTSVPGGGARAVLDLPAESAAADA